MSTQERKRKKREAEETIFAIDKSNLDIQWSEQPRLMFKYAKALSEARTRLDQAKSARDVREAELSRKIRSSPERYSIEKVTEGAIKEVITIKLAASKEQKELMAARENLELHQAYVQALEHRRHTLAAMVDLHGMSYFAEPTPKYTDNRTISDMKDKAAYTGSRRKRGGK